MEAGLVDRLGGRMMIPEGSGRHCRIDESGTVGLVRLRSCEYIGDVGNAILRAVECSKVLSEAWKHVGSRSSAQRNGRVHITKGGRAV